MTTALAETKPTHADSVVAEFLAMSDGQHLREMKTLKSNIDEWLERLGKAVYAWKMKGNRMEEVGMNGMTHWLLMVGCGELYAPLLIKTMRNYSLTRKLSTLSADDQKMIGDGGTVGLVTLSADGKKDIIQVSPVCMEDPHLLDQLLLTKDGKTTIRSESAQVLYIQSKRNEAAKPIPQRIGNFIPDPERDGCQFMGRHKDFISADCLRAAYLACRAGRNRKDKSEDE